MSVYILYKESSEQIENVSEKNWGQRKSCKIQISFLRLVKITLNNVCASYGYIIHTYNKLHPKQIVEQT